MNTADDILRKLLEEGDLDVWTTGAVPGVGLDYSWVHLTHEEAQYLQDLADEINRERQ